LPASVVRRYVQKERLNQPDLHRGEDGGRELEKERKKRLFIRLNKGLKTPI
jgi:hypothetical protein